MPQAPVAETRHHLVRSPHGDRTDPYYWLRDDSRRDPDIIAWLEAENDYTEQYLDRISDLRETLYREIVDRIEKDDSTVPFRYHGYYYYRRYTGDSEYAFYARRKGRLSAPEELILDANERARGHEFYQVGDYDVSPDSRYFAWAEDTDGRRLYTIHFKDLRTGEILEDRIPGADNELVWSDDNQSLLYIEKDPETLLGIRVRRHRLGTPAATDELVYELDDNSFQMSLDRSGDEKYILLHLGSTVSDEVHYMPAGDTASTFTVMLPRERDHEYDVDHVDNEWIIRTNWQATNFRLMRAADGAVGERAAWREMVPHDDAVLISDYDVFKDFIVLAERRDGLHTLRVIDRNGNELFPVSADDEAFVMDIDVNSEQDTDWLRYSYSSLTTPESIFEINVRTRERRLLKQDKVLGGFEPNNYRSERVWAMARDGTRVPVSLLYHKDFRRDGSAPLYQAGYGAYGISEDPAFEDEILSLVDRGFVYALAHIRGGQEMGREWYEQGRLANKLNSFNDFIDVTEHLVAEGYADPAQTVAVGGSAGGLLVGAVANMRPDLYRIIVAHVPFVDIVTTMLDESIPLTTLEYDEWGNPNKKKWYELMLSYSPYDNIKAQPYPALFVTTGLWDSQVQYYEPAKWVAKLRATKTDDNPLLFHINMDAGHGGQSGRFRRNRELAMEFAFILDYLGANK